MICDEHSKFAGSKWCQKTNDKDSVLKSCANDHILEVMQEMFPNVQADDGCYSVTFDGRAKGKSFLKGTVCLCSTDQCNATSKTRVPTILQLYSSSIVVLFLIFLTF